jgi:hypothetical protein
MCSGWREAALPTCGLKAAHQSGRKTACNVRDETRLNGNGVRRHDNVGHVGSDQFEAAACQMQTVWAEIELELLRRSRGSTANAGTVEADKAVFCGIGVDCDAKAEKVEDEKADAGFAQGRQSRLHGVEIGLAIGVGDGSDSVRYHRQAG